MSRTVREVDGRHIHRGAERDSHIPHPVAKNATRMGHPARTDGGGLVLPPHLLFGEVVVEGLYGRKLVVADIEDRVELRYVQDVVNFLGQV